MPAEAFLQEGHRMVEWIGRYLEGIESRPVLPAVEPGEIRRRLERIDSDEAADFTTLLEDFETTVLPGITHWNHPSFHAWFASTSSGPGILGEFLAAALNANGMLWLASPAASELEEHVLDRLREWMGLPAGFTGAIQDTASVSTFHALAGARARAYPDAREEGIFGQRPGRIYGSSESHSSVEKGVMALGFGRSGFLGLPVDEEFALRPDALREAVRRDREAGIRPVAVVATIGTTPTTGIDPVEEIAAIAREEGLWLHVDAAYGGSAALLPELRPLFRGWEKADSIVVNPHKWLFTPMDCSVLYLRDEAPLRAAFSLVPDYLKSGSGARNAMDTGLALGRRFRSLKLWFVLRYFGREGIRIRVREHIRLARLLAEWIDADPDWERIAPVPFGLVAFRLRAPSDAEADRRRADRRTERVLARLNAGGRVFLASTTIDGRRVIRFAIGNLRTEERHLRQGWELLRSTAAEMAGDDVSGG